MSKSNHQQSNKKKLGVKHTDRRVQAKQDKPNLQAIVASPGWQQMSLSARVIALTLFALARMDAGNSVTISRKGLSDLVGITDPSTLARANREMQAIGLFAIDRGYRTKYAQRPTVYRLNWWSPIFQRWLKAGYAVPETITSTTTDTPHHHGTSTSGRLALPAAPLEGPPSEAQNNLSDVPALGKVNDLQPIGQAV